MKTKEIKKTLKLLLANTLDIPLENIRTESTISDDLGIDSFVMIELCFLLEDKFNIQILNDTNNFPHIVTVKDLLDFLKSKISANRIG